MTCAPLTTDRTIVCDVDGVLCDFIECLRLMAFQRHEDVAAPDVRKLCKNDMHFFTLVDRMIRTNQHPFLSEGAQELIDALIAHKHYLIATAPIAIPELNGRWYDFRLSWLMNLGIPHERVQYMSPIAKAQLTGCMLIEDSEPTVELWNQNQKKRGLPPSGNLVAQPWNRGRLTVRNITKAVKVMTLMTENSL